MYTEQNNNKNNRSSHTLAALDICSHASSQHWLSGNFIFFFSANIRLTGGFSWWSTIRPIYRKNHWHFTFHVQKEKKKKKRKIHRLTVTILSQPLEALLLRPYETVLWTSKWYIKTIHTLLSHKRIIVWYVMCSRATSDQLHCNISSCSCVHWERRTGTPKFDCFWNSLTPLYNIFKLATFKIYL